MTKKIRIRSLGRIISELDDFVLKGVSGMVIDGVLTIFWSTGRRATTELHYDYTEFDEQNYGTETVSGTREYHKVDFPTTFVDTYHYFRVTSTDPISGITKTSDVYRVYVTSVLDTSLEIGDTNTAFEALTVEKVALNSKHSIEMTNGRLDITPDAVADIKLNFSRSGILVPNHDFNHPIHITTNIKNTNVA